MIDATTSVFSWWNIAAQLNIWNDWPPRIQEAAAKIISLHNRYADAHDDKYLQAIAGLADTYVPDSIKAFGFDEIGEFEQEVRQVFPTTKSSDELANPPSTFFPSTDTDTKLRQALAITRLWKGLEQSLNDAEEQASKLGLTTAEFAKLDLPARSRLYATAKKEGRV